MMDFGRAFDGLFKGVILLIAVAAALAVYVIASLTFGFFGESNWEKCRAMSTDAAKIECMNAFEGGSDDQ